MMNSNNIRLILKIRYLLIIISLCPFILISQNQLIDNNIILPSPITGLQKASFGIFNNATGTFYVCGEGGKYIIECDGATNNPIKRIPIHFSADQLVINNSNNKLYATETYGDSLVVIDCYTNNVIKYVPMADTFPGTSLVYNPANNKIYCGRKSIWVIDGDSDEIVDQIAVEGNVYDLDLNTVENKLYASFYSESEIVIIDGSTNIISNSLNSIEFSSNMCYNPLNNKVYFHRNDGRLAVLDGSTDSIIKNFPELAINGDLLYNPLSNKIYVGNTYPEDGIAIINGETDELIKKLPDVYPSFMQYNPANNTVYSKTFLNDHIDIIDGVSDNVIGVIPINYSYYESIYNPISKSVVLFHSNNSLLEVINADSHILEKLVPLGMRPQHLCYNSTKDKLYIIDPSTDLLVVADAKTNEAIKHIFLGSKGGKMLYVPEFEKIYVTHPSSNHLTVIDGENDIILETVIVGLKPIELTYCSSNESVYCSNNEDNFISVIACENDLVTENIALSGYPNLSFYHEENDQLYVTNTNQGKLTIINCADNSIEKQIIIYHGATSIAFSDYTNTLYMNSYGGWFGVVNCYENTSEIYEIPNVMTSTDMTYNPLNDKLYFTYTGSSDIIIVECSDYSIIKSHKMEDEYLQCISYQPVENKIIVGSWANYSANEPSVLHVIDGESDELLQTVICGKIPNSMLYEPKLKKTYISCSGLSEIHVVNDSLLLSTPDPITSHNETFILSVFPNPVTNSATLEYTLEQPSSVQITIFNLLGNQVAEIWQVQSNGKQQVTWDAVGFPPGVYFYRLQAGDKGASGKMILNK